MQAVNDLVISGVLFGMMWPETPGALTRLRVSLFAGEPETPGAVEVTHAYVERSASTWVQIGAELEIVRNRDWLEFPPGKAKPTHWAIGTDTHVLFHGKISKWEAEQNCLAPGSVRISIS